MRRTYTLCHVLTCADSSVNPIRRLKTCVFQVLPQHVPSPLVSFTWEDMQAIEVPDMIQQLHHASWLLSDAFPRLSPEATGNASREDLEWAVSVSLLLPAPTPSAPCFAFPGLLLAPCCLS